MNENPLLTIRIREYGKEVYTVTSTSLNEIQIYAGLFQMDEVVKSMGVDFRLPFTLIYDIIKKECEKSGSSAAVEFLKEYTQTEPEEEHYDRPFVVS